MVGPRSSAIAILVALIAAVANVSRAQGTFDAPFFNKIKGDWVGDGKFTDANGEETEIHEEWRAAPTDQGTYLVTGSRTWGDETQEFRWEYHFNATTELYECEYWHTGMEDPIRFEVSLGDDFATLRSASSSEGSITVENRITEEGIEGAVSLKDANGQETLGGTVSHRPRT